MEGDGRSLFEHIVESGLARDYVSKLSPAEAEQFRYDWRLFRRAAQIPPEWGWRVWLILAGRGFGKTRTGSEWIREEVRTGRAGRVALVGRTAADVRDTMLEGDSGILTITPKAERPTYVASKRRLTWPNGATATCYSAEEPDRLRGPNHDLAWSDEVAAWRYSEAWDQLMFGLRIGSNPRVIATTTPRPTKLIRTLIEREDVAVTSGSTYDNISNLSPSFVAEMKSRYEGTRLGRQELHAELLTDVQGALWTPGMIEDGRLSEAPPLKRIVVAIDPAASAGEDSDETGIIVAGIGEDGKGYVLDDKSMRASPNDWASAAIQAYHFYKADRIVAESNQGGDMISHTIRTIDGNVPIKLVHASRGKRTRAEPVAALYEQQRVHHVGMFAALEDQLTTWTGDTNSPDRLDALVWALTELMVGRSAPDPVVPFQSTRQSPWKV